MYFTSFVDLALWMKPIERLGEFPKILFYFCDLKTESWRIEERIPSLCRELGGTFWFKTEN
jgi:hypothetical protein